MEIEISGHKAKVSSIRGVKANSCCFQEEDYLLVMIFLDKPEQGISVLFLEIPVKLYTKEELLQTIMQRGTAKFLNMLEDQKATEAYQKNTEMEKNNLDAIARRASELLM